MGPDPNGPRGAQSRKDVFPEIRFDGFRIAQKEAKVAGAKLQLKFPPADGADAWFTKDYTDLRRIKDREMFS